MITSRSPVKLLVEDARIEFIALDFTNHHEALAQAMEQSCKDVTHAYFSSYIHKDDFAELNLANKALFENFLQALILAAPNLQNCTLQTGGKYYGLHLGPVPTPCREEEPRRGKADENFYFPQEDFLAEKQKGERSEVALECHPTRSCYRAYQQAEWYEFSIKLCAVLHDL